VKTILNSYPLLRNGKVINTTDPEKLGRIQLKVYPELSDIPDDDCPWCFPANGGVHGKSFSVPLVDQVISCFVLSKYWNEITFLPFNVTKPTEHLFDEWIKNQKSKIADMKTDPEEEHLAVDQFEDDFSVFHDSKNSQHGILHPSGTYIFINKDGELFIRAVKKITFSNGDDSSVTTTINSENGDIELKTKGNIKIETNGNTVIDAKGNTDIKGSNITIDASVMLTLKTGDATSWVPNVVIACPWGMSHGGIVKLKGG
jgi:hypothetical protein